MPVVSAPGKIHLVGEHAVVYGEPAILSAIGLRTVVSAKKLDEVVYADRRFGGDEIRYDLDEVSESAEKTKALWKKCSEKKNFSDLFRFVKADRYANYRKSVVGLALQELGISGGVSLSISGDLPVGSGLGSSSSLSVALPYAISLTYGKKTGLDKINGIAFELEKIIHGTPSGGDNAASCYGGLVCFQRSEKGNIIKSVTADMENMGRFFIVLTPKPEIPTGELVQRVRDLDPQYRDERIKRIGDLSRNMLEVLANSDSAGMKETINQAHKCLAELGVSTKQLDALHDAVAAIGGAAKLCGAGGGGAALCYHENPEELIKIIEDFGFSYWQTRLAAEGVRKENAE